MAIVVGSKFRCISDVVTNNGEICYIKDKIYKSEMFDCITDEQGNIKHSWAFDESESYTWRNYFVSVNGLGNSQTAFDIQIGGEHYKKLAIQPMEYALKNNLNFGQANAIKYITRYRDKNGVQDLEKAKHCIDLLIEFENNNK